MHDEHDRAGRARKCSPFLTGKQAAHYLGLADKTLTNMRSLGTGPAYRRHGGQVRYHIDDLEEWSRNHRHKTRDQARGKVPDQACGKAVGQGDDDA